MSDDPECRICGRLIWQDPSRYGSAWVETAPETSEPPDHDHEPRKDHES